MNEHVIPIGHPQASSPSDDVQFPRRSAAPYRSQWSLLISVLCASVLITAIGTILWFAVTVPKLARVDNPDQALALMVSRMMEGQDGLRRLPVWQQNIMEWMTGGNDTEREQAIEWYRELIQTTNDRLSKLYLTILLSEFGHRQEALTTATAWQRDDPSMQLFGQLIEAAYGDASLDSGREGALQAALAEAVPNGWFYNYLAAQLARRAGDEALLETVDRQIAVRGDHVQRWTSPLIGFELLCLIVGSLILVKMVVWSQYDTHSWRLHRPGVPPPWSGRTGAAIVLRGGALGAGITLVFLSLPSLEHASLRALAIPLANIPLLALAYVYLLKPAGLTFRDGFGLHIDCYSVGRLAGVVLATVAAGLWGEWVMGRVTNWFELSNHWTEWFDPDLVWASSSTLIVSLAEYVVFAPIFEELAFRGLLYALLRRRFQFLPAALISSSIFALAHGYGVIGFVSVFWSGFLWAWVYERTGSLIPGMIAHATNNLIVCLMVMTLLR